MDSKIKYIEEPSQFLIDTGLLFEINRRILHPLGLALQLDTESQIFAVWDCRDDKEGVVYDDATLVKGANKFAQFMLDYGWDKYTEREAETGFIIQPIDFK